MVEITLEELRRKIFQQCHVCGSMDINYHFVGTKTHYYSCEKHKSKVLRLNANEDNTVKKGE